MTAIGSDRLHRTVKLELDQGRARTLAEAEAIAASQRRPLLLTRRAHLHEAQRAIVERTIERYRDAVVVSMLEPFDLPLFGSARHLLAAYGDDAASIGGLADVLFGGSLPSGVLPVALELPA